MFFQGKISTKIKSEKKENEKKKPYSLIVFIKLSRTAFDACELQNTVTLTEISFYNFFFDVTFFDTSLCSTLKEMRNRN